MMRYSNTVSNLESNLDKFSFRNLQYDICMRQKKDKEFKIIKSAISFQLLCISIRKKEFSKKDY